MGCLRLFSFFVKQKTAYEMRISDWSSDVCSSDLFLASSTVVSVIFLLLLGFVIAAYNGPANGLVITISDKRVRGLSVALVQFGANLVGFGLGPVFIGGISEALGGGVALRWGMGAALIFYLGGALPFKIGRASCRERVGQYG